MVVPIESSLRSRVTDTCNLNLKFFVVPKFFLKFEYECCSIHKSVISMLSLVEILILKTSTLSIEKFSRESCALRHSRTNLKKTKALLQVKIYANEIDSVSNYFDCLRELNQLKYGQIQKSEIWNWVMLVLREKCDDDDDDDHDNWNCNLFAGWKGILPKSQPKFILCNFKVWRNIAQTIGFVFSQRSEHQKFLYVNYPEPWTNNLIPGDFQKDMLVAAQSLRLEMLLGILVNFLALCQYVLITANDEKLRDPEGYEAITQLHHQMDDDQSGSIDRFESTDVIMLQQIFFLKEDMQLGGLDRAKRERAFHHNHDELITVDDLWEAWFACEERSWTTTDMVNWLEYTVRLPQYASVFIGMEIDGRALPRMAVANSTYLLTDLGIKNSVHKQKLRLKALDVVLFGFSDGNTSRLKDIALSILVIVLVTVLFVLKMQRTRSHMQMEQLAAKLLQLKSMQSNFEDIQQKFEEEQKKRQSSRGAAENEQVETLKSQLMEAERLLENSGSAPLALQPLLRSLVTNFWCFATFGAFELGSFRTIMALAYQQGSVNFVKTRREDSFCTIFRTCELEVSYIGQQRMECIAEMREAIEHIDKLRKKQSSLVSSIKLATGASSGTDHIDSRIFALKRGTKFTQYSLRARMEKISLAMSECHQRWTEIESLCGFPLVPTSVAAEIVFPSTVASSVLPRSGSSSSFYRKSDLVGATVTASMASSSTSGNSPPVIMEDIRGRTSPPVCVCTYESFASAGARYMDSLNSQRDIHENGNASRPLKVVADSNKLLQHSSSSGFSKCCHIGPVAKIQTSRNQSIGPLMETVTDVISETPTVNKVIAPTASLSTTVNRFLPFKQDLKLLKRSVSNAIFRPSSNTKTNGFVVVKGKNMTDVRKSRFGNFFHRSSKI
ncbi:unnamed protein product [Brugia pahangi]|uniref:SAM domain-containing protein n=2 Tax=Brugia TaxID=6278 RepID=A0A0N4TIX3_BRUPA|nr:unnamed protein product [Brugia pahangi]